MILPSSGETTLAQIQNALAAGETLLGSPAGLRLRALLVVGSDSAWHNYQVDGLLVPIETDLGERVLDLGDVRLLEWWTDNAALLAPDGLRLALARWRDVIGAPSGFQFQEAVRLYRDFPGAAPLDTPTWRLDLHEKVPQAPQSTNLPAGPFYHDDLRLFAQDVKGLAAQWFGGADVSDRPSAQNHYAIRIPDYRARFTGIQLADQSMAIACARLTSGPLDLRCAWQWTGFRGDIRNGVEDVTFSDGSTDCEIEIAVASGLQTLKLWLLDARGYCYDQFYELPGRPGSLTIGGVSRGGSAELHDLRHTGESDTVEFKKWVSAVSDDGKRRELVESACALANSAGGTIYIGVDEHGEIVGTGRYLRKDYRKGASDMEPVRDKYTASLRRILTEAIAPTLTPKFEWLDLAGHLVLAIRISRGSDRPYELLENSTSYLRRGATNRRAGPRDLGESLTRI